MREAAKIEAKQRALDTCLHSFLHSTHHVSLAARATGASLGCIGLVWEEFTCLKGFPEVARQVSDKPCTQEPDLL